MLENVQASDRELRGSCGERGINRSGFMNPPSPTPRSRLLYMLWMALAVGSGLLLRSRFVSLPKSVEKYGGAAIWALMVFLGLALIFRRASTLRVGLLALGFAWTIEFLQLYHAPWIDRIREMRIGHLVLGSTFNAPDLLAYAAGISVGVIFECIFRRTAETPLG
jgi:hypothetical protein